LQGNRFAVPNLMVFYQVQEAKKRSARGNPTSFTAHNKSGSCKGLQMYGEASRTANGGALWKAVIPLFKENKKECFYIYRLKMNNHAQTGFVALSSVDDYENNIIKNMSLPRRIKELDRINHIKITGAQTGECFGLQETMRENWIALLKNGLRLKRLL